MTPPRWYLATASAPLCTSAPYIAWLAATSVGLVVVADEPYTYDTNIWPTFCSRVIAVACAAAPRAGTTASARTESTTRIRRMRTSLRNSIAVDEYCQIMLIRHRGHAPTVDPSAY